MSAVGHEMVRQGGPLRELAALLAGPATAFRGTVTSAVLTTDPAAARDTSLGPRHGTPADPGPEPPAPSPGPRASSTAPRAATPLHIPSRRTGGAPRSA